MARKIIASAIYRGFRAYKEEIDQRSNLAVVVKEKSPEKLDIINSEPAVSVTEPESIPADQIVFSIQIASSKNKSDTDPSSFRGQTGIMVIEDGRWYKYLVGRETNYHHALERCNGIKSEFPDAFVVASKNGKLIPLNEALVEINR